MSDKIVRYADVKVIKRAIGEEENEKREVEGIACVFNQSTDLGWYTEEIDRNAFDECKMDDVVLNFNHDNNMILARTTNGSLELSIDDEGLHQKATIVDTSTGRDVLTLVKEGLISKMSFAFTIDENEWIEKKGEKDHRIITKIARLYDVSLVTFPAYNQTSAFARDEDSLVKEHRAYLEKLEMQNKKMGELINGNSI